jgi:hypothetical protein
MTTLPGQTVTTQFIDSHGLVKQASHGVVVLQMNGDSRYPVQRGVMQ